MPSARASFDGELSEVPAARRFIRSTLTDWDAEHLEWAASQILTELATNAVLHARTRFLVELSFDGSRLTMRLADGSPKLPVQRRHSEAATTGRGLALVGAMSAEWGVEPTGQGKAIWVEITADADDGSGLEEVAFDLAADIVDFPPPAPDAGADVICRAA